MNPARAAWFFIAGLTWLVLRGLIGSWIPELNPEAVVREGGVMVLIPVLSVLASATIPAFFISFLIRHDFTGAPALRITTITAVVASVFSLVLVVSSLAAIIRGTEPALSLPLPSGFWIREGVTLLLAGGLLGFLVAFAAERRFSTRLRRAAVVGAAGAAIPTLMMVLALAHASSPESSPWFPVLGMSPLARLLGLVAAGTLVWFLETFAQGYGSDEPGRDLDS
jgi:hypothetical protein